MNLFNSFLEKIYRYKNKLFYSFLLITFLLVFAIFLNLLGLKMPFVFHGWVSSGYLDTGYRFPGLLGSIGSQGSVAYASYSFYILMFINRFNGLKKGLIFLFSFIALINSFLAGGSGLLFFLIFTSSSFTMYIFRLFLTKKISKKFIQFVLALSLFLIIFLRYIFSLNNVFGLKYLLLIFRSSDSLLTTGTTGYLYKGLFTFPSLVQNSLIQLQFQGFESMLFGLKTNLNLPGLTDYGL